MSSQKFPASIPRAMYWSHEVDGSSCPNCGGALEAEHHIYLMATRRRGEEDFFMVSNTAGRFCDRCPTVVLDRDGRPVAINVRGEQLVAIVDALVHS
jgi:hypothetical protein